MTWNVYGRPQRFWSRFLKHIFRVSKEEWRSVSSRKYQVQFSDSIARAETMAATTMATALGTASAAVREDLEHLQSCTLDGLAAARVGAMLQGLSSNKTGLRAACWQEGIGAQRDGRYESAEALRDLLKAKLLSILPPIAFQALLEQYGSPAVQAELADYGDTPVAAREAGKVKELVCALGSGVQREMVRRVASAWGIGTRDTRGQTRGVESFKSELRGACIRFLKEAAEAAPAEEASGSRAVAPAMVEESVEQVAAVACSERAVAPGIGEAGEVWPPQAAVERGPTTLGEAVRWIEEKQMVPMKRMTGKRQAVGVIPPELSNLLKGLHAGSLTKKEQVPSMLFAGCKEQRKHGRRVVRPSSDFARMEKLREVRWNASDSICSWMCNVGPWIGVWRHHKPWMHLPRASKMLSIGKAHLFLPIFGRFAFRATGMANTFCVAWRPWSWRMRLWLHDEMKCHCWMGLWCWRWWHSAGKCEKGAQWKVLIR